MIPTRNIVFNFNTSGFEVLEKYNQTKNYCFDDLGVEPTGSHYAKECNVMGEILLSHYDLFIKKVANNQQLTTSNQCKTHITTNLNVDEIEKRYGSRIRSRVNNQNASPLDYFQDNLHVNQNKNYDEPL